ncbi:hypothetical protein QMG61_13430 [Cryobacterium sp. PH31-AA6]|uniref:hypothetical protein n=1 Tax=Cryobacterium sp. PH31-AA6 TaxID=3046205 RepID=UPI0024B9DECF|nr:hypothetical protein [Cryobacterium sp. PH31-AA6]MDJ0324760.1 hypothetical protein [Cryobacterium sp. PH31-AA6]
MQSERTTAAVSGRSPVSRLAGSVVIAGGALRRWPARRWWIALTTAVGTYLVIAIPTDLIDTPFFAREIAPTTWSWPALAVSSILAGLVFATYVAYPEGAAPSRSEGRLGLAGWMITFFAVGCPVCNKIVLLALGASGALQFFEPVQPYLAGASILLLGWALHARLTRESSCALNVVEPTKESVTL